MKNYIYLKEIYKPVFLNYIINRSKKLSKVASTDYDDLTQEGLLVLIEMYNKNKEADDPLVMIALVRKYNGIASQLANRITFISLDETYHQEVGGD